MYKEIKQGFPMNDANPCPESRNFGITKWDWVIEMKSGPEATYIVVYSL